jgi:oxygen-independent coproporphyrinogen-3 oxidase
MNTNLEKMVPRYTSYPTAPHFISSVNADTYRSWISTLPNEATLSIYLHVPYCRELCHYCGCNTKATQKHEPIVAYAARLAEEIATVARYAGKRKVTHLHWGGGTPSILGADLLKFITDELRAHFDLTSIHEHAIELDPRVLTRPLLQTLRDIGVNRASLGVQDFSLPVQQAVGRIQPFEQVKYAVAMLRECGIERINLDLMYGLPRQTLRDVENSLTLAHALKPQRIAVFGYAHVPWFKPQQRLIDESELPSGQERLLQAQAAHELLVQFGYQPVGLDHYAQPNDELAQPVSAGKLHRNFQGYTVDDADALLGLGASAVSRLPQGFAQNAPDVGSYARAIEAGKLATVKGIVLSDDDRIRGHIIEQLMCGMAVDLTAVSHKAGFDIEKEFSQALELLKPFKDDGSVQIDGHRVAVTEKGRPFVRLVASAFDAYLKRNGAIHSSAV